MSISSILSKSFEEDVRHLDSRLTTLLDQVKQHGLINHINSIEDSDAKPYDVSILNHLYDDLFSYLTEKTAIDDEVDRCSIIIRFVNMELENVVHNLKSNKFGPIKSLPPEATLVLWVDRWTKFKRFVTGVGIVFQYIDEHYLKNCSITQQCFTLFHHIIYMRYKDLVIKAVTSSVESHRANIPINIPVLRSATASLIELGSYINPNYPTSLYFELSQALENQLWNVFSVKAEEWTVGNDVISYIMQVNDAFTAELEGRVNIYLHNSSYEPFKTILHNITLRKTLSNVLNTEGALSLLFDATEASRKYLSILFKLCSSDPESVNSLASCLQTQITLMGSAIYSEGKEKIVKAPEAEKIQHSQNLVYKLLSLNLNYSKSVIDFCDSSAKLMLAIKEAFNSIINKDSIISEELAGFAHNLLRKNNTFSEYSSVTYKDIALMYSYIREKDRFELKYAHLFARRLLTDDYISLEKESEITKLLVSNQAANEFTQTIDRMVDDVTSSSVFTEKLLQHKSDVLPIKLDPTIITNTWPDLLPGSRFKDEQTLLCDEAVPKDIQTCMNIVRAFYSSDSSNVVKKLKFRHELGSIEIGYKFDNGPERIFIMNTLMGFVLLYIDEETASNKFAFWNKLVQTFTRTSDVKSSLTVFLTAVTRALIEAKIVKTTCKEYLTTGVFNADAKFKVENKYTGTSQNRSIHIDFTPPTYVDLESVNEGALLKARRTMIDATVIKLMKARKQLNFSDLKNLATAQITHFTLDNLHFKESIDSLLHEDYIKRDDADKDLFHYVA